VKPLEGNIQCLIRALMVRGDFCARLQRAELAAHCSRRFTSGYLLFAAAAATLKNRHRSCNFVAGKFFATKLLPPVSYKMSVELSQESGGSTIFVLRGQT
jgi:hypothetical protein